MENSQLVSLSRQIALTRQLDVIANNMANVSTNGFRARSSRFAEFEIPTASADSFVGKDRIVSFVIDSGTPIDVSQGAIEATGNPLNVAVKGDAFLVVDTPNGERYTRNGSFQINAQSQLVTSDGYQVLGENGPIAIGNRDTGIAFAQDGTLTTNQGKRGKLRLVRFDNPASLANEGTNLLSSRAQPQPAGALGQVEPGAIERSNVNPVVEMTRLIEVNRAYTSLATMMGRMDDMKRTAISRLADASSS